MFTLEVGPREAGGHIGMHSYTYVCCNDFYTSWQHMRAMNVYLNLCHAGFVSIAGSMFVSIADSVLISIGIAVSMPISSSIAVNLTS